MSGETDNKNTPEDKTSKSEDLSAHFDKGFGKGAAKGRSEGKAEATADFLKELGVPSIEAAKKMAALGVDVSEQKRKQAEQQGEFKSLYEDLKAKADGMTTELTAAKSRLTAFEDRDKKELETLSEGLSDEHKKLVENIPLAQAVLIARELSTKPTDKKKDIGIKAGGGGGPDKDGGHDLTYYKKLASEVGWANLKPEQRAEIERLQAEAGSKSLDDVLEEGKQFGSESYQLPK